MTPAQSSSSNSSKPRRRIGRPPPEVSAETRGALIAAACRCFGRHGYDGTTTRVIAEEAGLTVGALYYYFESKPGIYAAAAAEVGEALIKRLRPAAGKGPDFGDGVAAMLDEAVQMHREDPSLAAFVSLMPIELSSHPELAESVGEVGASLLTLFREVAEGPAEEGRLTHDVDHVATMTLGMLMGFSLLARVLPSAEQYEGAAAAARAFLQGDLVTPRRAVPPGAG